MWHVRRQKCNISDEFEDGHRDGKQEKHMPKKKEWGCQQAKKLTDPPKRKMGLMMIGM